MVDRTYRQCLFSLRLNCGTTIEISINKVIDSKINSILVSIKLLIMKKSVLASLIFLFGIFAYAQSAVGTWKTIDDKTGKEKSQVKISETSNGSLKGEVIKILTPGKENAKCEDCKGSNKNKPIKGMTILWDLKKDGSEWSGGRILDPNSGKEYSCKMKLKDKNTLEVRGFMGVSLLGRTQTWYRVE